MALLNCKGVIALGCVLSRKRVKQQQYRCRGVKQKRLRYRGVHSCILPEGACFRLCGMHVPCFISCLRHTLVPVLWMLLAAIPLPAPCLPQVRTRSRSRTEETSACLERNCILGKSHKLACGSYFMSLHSALSLTIRLYWYAVLFIPVAYLHKSL